MIKKSKKKKTHIKSGKDNIKRTFQVYYITFIEKVANFFIKKILPNFFYKFSDLSFQLNKYLTLFYGWSQKFISR